MQPRSSTHADPRPTRLCRRHPDQEHRGSNDEGNADLGQPRGAEGSIDGDDTFFQTMGTRCSVYRKLNGSALTASAEVVTFGVLIAGIAATAKSIADIAIALA
jgi:hypothetical protein